MAGIDGILFCSSEPVVYYLNLSIRSWCYFPVLHSARLPDVCSTLLFRFARYSCEPLVGPNTCLTPSAYVHVSFLCNFQDRWASKPCTSAVTLALSPVPSSSKAFPTSLRYSLSGRTPCFALKAVLRYCANPSLDANW